MPEHWYSLIETRESWPHTPPGPRWKRKWNEKKKIRQLISVSGSATQYDFPQNIHQRWIVGLSTHTCMHVCLCARTCLCPFVCVTHHSNKSRWSVCFPEGSWVCVHHVSSQCRLNRCYPLHTFQWRETLPRDDWYSGSLFLKRLFLIQVVRLALQKSLGSTSMQSGPQSFRRADENQHHLTKLVLWFVIIKTADFQSSCLNLFLWNWNSLCSKLICAHFGNHNYIYIYIILYLLKKKV